MILKISIMLFLIGNIIPQSKSDQASLNNSDLTKEKKCFEIIIDSLNKIGYTYKNNYDTITNWSMDTKMLLEVFNKGYKTTLFDSLKITNDIYYSNDKIDTMLGYIKITELTFNSIPTATNTYNLIKEGKFFSYFIGSREWDFILKDDKIFFMCGLAYDFWNKHSPIVKSIIEYSTKNCK